MLPLRYFKIEFLLKIQMLHIQECKEVEFPKLPYYYTATLQYNVAHKERFNFGACALRGDCAPRSESNLPPTHDLGMSFSIVETIDDRKRAAFLIAEAETSYGNGTQVKSRDY